MTEDERRAIETDVEQLQEMAATAMQGALAAGHTCDPEAIVAAFTEKLVEMCPATVKIDSIDREERLIHITVTGPAYMMPWLFEGEVMTEDEGDS